VIEMKAFVKPFIEQEIGYTVAERISEPVRDVDELKKKIKDVFPAVELPDIRFADMKTLKGPDLVADAVSSAKYITGNRLPFGAVDPNVQEVTLTRDGKEINRGPASDVLGDQYKALMSLVNCAVSQGRVIEPGHVLITGAVGAMIPGTPGVYEGAWGALGTVAWTMK
jgi:2-keto-4-pentenoate hydratase